MPVYTVTDSETGLVLELTGDSPPTDAELAAIFAEHNVPAIPAQQTPRARQIQQNQQIQRTRQEQPEEQGFFGRAGDVALSVVEPALSIASSAVAEPIAGLLGIGAGAFGGAGLATETIESTRDALTFEPRSDAGKASLENIGEFFAPAGEAVGAVENVLGDFGDEIAGPVGGAIGKTIPTAILTALGVRVKRGAAPKIDEAKAKEVKEIIAAGDRLGIDVLTTDLLPAQSIGAKLASQLAEKIPVIGTGGKRAAQQRQRVDAIKELSEQTLRVEPAEIFANLSKNAKLAKRKAGATLGNIELKLTPIGRISLEKTTSALTKARDKITRKGLIKSKEVEGILDKISEALEEGDGSFSTLRGLRTDIRELGDSVDGLGRSQLLSKEKVLVNGVIKALGKDLEDFVLTKSGPAALKDYRRANLVYAQEARDLTKSKLKRVLDKGDISPEIVNDMLFSRKKSEVKLLHKNLDEVGRAHARTAIYSRALDKATDINTGDISPDKFIAEMNRIRSSGDGVGVFFKGDDLAQLEGLVKVIAATKRAAEAAVSTPTGQGLFAAAGVGLTGSLAVGSAKAVGTALSAATVAVGARILETPKVRDKLIRLGRVRTRSSAGVRLTTAIPIALAEAISRVEGEMSSDREAILNEVRRAREND